MSVTEFILTLVLILCPTILLTALVLVTALGDDA